MTHNHGDDLYRYDNIIANFSSNVYSGANNQALIKHLQSYIAIGSSSYPEPEPYTLQKELAEYYGISPDCVLVTNGATEAIYLVAHLLEGEHVSIQEPTFSEYRMASQIYKCNICDNAPIKWICNPNNPTGLLNREISKIEKELLIEDRSYEYFCREGMPPPEIIDSHIYIYSLTKRYRIPGIRLGYIITSEKLASRLRKLRQPWSVNAIAIEAGLWIVRHRFPNTIERDTLFVEADRLAKELSKIDGVEVYETDTHFMLLRTPMLSSELKDLLAMKYQILIRDASNFPTLSPYHIRLATQSTTENNLLLDALRNILK